MDRTRTKTTLRRIIMRHLDHALTLAETATWLMLISKAIKETLSLINSIK